MEGQVLTNDPKLASTHQPTEVTCTLYSCSMVAPMRGDTFPICDIYCDFVCLRSFKILSVGSSYERWWLVVGGMFGLDSVVLSFIASTLLPSETLLVRRKGFTLWGLSGLRLHTDIKFGIYNVWSSCLLLAIVRWVSVCCLLWIACAMAWRG